MREAWCAPIVGVGLASADVDARFLMGCHRGQRQPGACFSAAAEYVLTNGQPDLVLVHGVLTKPIVFDHAWVLLPGGVVFDPVDQDFYHQAAYEALLGAAPEACYGAIEVRAALTVHCNSGPWHKPAAEAITRTLSGHPSASAVAPLVGWENLKAGLSAFGTLIANG
jgi:hypothetical protein